MATRNGQKAEKPDEDTSVELHITGLSRAITKGTIKKFFKQFGSGIKFVSNRNNDSSDAYISYTNPEHAAEAVEQLKTFEIEGHPCCVEYSMRMSYRNTIFVKEFDNGVSVEDLRIAFEEYGEIFFDDFKTGTDRPHGIVQYRDPKDATKAIEAADSEEGLWINERKLFVERYEDKNRRFRKIFFKEIPPEMEMTIEDLIEKFSQFGEFAEDPSDADADGVRSIKFRKCESAYKAFKKAGECGLAVGRSKHTIKVIAKPKPGKGRRAPRNKSNSEQAVKEPEPTKKGNKSQDHGGRRKLHVGNLSPEITDEALQEMFEQFGVVTNVQTKHTKAKSNAYGFVTFSTHDQAEEALQKMKNNEKGFKVSRARRIKKSRRANRPSERQEVDAENYQASEEGDD